MAEYCYFCYLGSVQAESLFFKASQSKLGGPLLTTCLGTGTGSLYVQGAAGVCILEC